MRKKNLQDGSSVFSVVYQSVAQGELVGTTPLDLSQAFQI